MAVLEVGCPRCKGEGEIRDKLKRHEEWERFPCPVCRGSGWASMLKPMGAPPKRLPARRAS